MYPYNSFHKDQSFNPGYKNGVLPEDVSAILPYAGNRSDHSPLI
jgi:hypothetical protein